MNNTKKKKQSRFLDLAFYFITSKYLSQIPKYPNSFTRSFLSRIAKINCCPLPNHRNLGIIVPSQQPPGWIPFLMLQSILSSLPRSDYWKEFEISYLWAKSFLLSISLCIFILLLINLINLTGQVLWFCNLALDDSKHGYFSQRFLVCLISVLSSIICKVCFSSYSLF